MEVVDEFWCGGWWIDAWAWWWLLVLGRRHGLGVGWRVKPRLSGAVSCWFACARGVWKEKRRALSNLKSPHLLTDSAGESPFFSPTIPIHATAYEPPPSSKSGPTASSPVAKLKLTAAKPALLHSIDPFIHTINPFAPASTQCRRLPARTRSSPPPLAPHHPSPHHGSFHRLFRSSPPHLSHTPSQPQQPAFISLPPSPAVGPS